ncbi:MAG: EI24 domain-containing protein [Defluviicoccus sp.]|nr:EI24 domain-containing protein [Defluviicoccus sp.]
MPRNLLLAVRQAFDPAFRAVAIKTAAVSAALFAALILAMGWALHAIELVGIGWLDWAIKALAGAGAVVLGLMLFPLLATMAVGLFLEEIADAVDAWHYPDKPEAPGQSILSSTVSTAKLVLVALALNVLVLPLYLLPGLNVFVFYGLNGYLLGREYFELVALRRLEPGTTRRVYRRSRWRIFVGGILITLLLSIPVVNWLMPMIATAFMVHEFDALERRHAGT